MRATFKNIIYILQICTVPHSSNMHQQKYIKYLQCGRHCARRWECKDQWGTSPALKGFTVQEEIQALNPKICNSSLRVRKDKKEIKIRFVGMSAYSWDMKTWIQKCKSWEKGSTLEGSMTIFKSSDVKKLVNGKWQQFRPQGWWKDKLERNLRPYCTQFGCYHWL